MKEPSPTAPKIVPEGLATPLPVEQAEGLLRCLGQVVSNMGIYGPPHKATRLSMEEAFAALGKILAQQESVILGTTEDRLHCSGHTIEADTALLRGLVRRLVAIGGGSMGLTRGISREEFERVMQLICSGSGNAAAQGGGLATAAQGGGFAHLSVKKMNYQAVAEDELVVHKEAVTQLAAQVVENQVAVTAAASAEILAFLQGGGASGAATISKEAEELAAQPAKLAELLLQAADVRPEAADLADGESLGNMVVGCLRRLHGKLSAAPSGKSQQGKKNLSRTLVLLEKEVVEKLRTMSGDVAADTAAGAISKEVNSLVEDLRIDALADDYLKKRRLSDATEDQLVKFIADRQGEAGRSASLRELEKKLTDGGLDRCGWERLLLKGGAGGEESVIGSSSLPLLLMRLTDLLGPAKAPPTGEVARAQVHEVVSALNQSMTTAMVGVEQKVDDLQVTMQKVRPLASGSQPADVEEQARARKNVITTLAEIVQELRQPLSVINGSIEMLCAGHLGLVPDIQIEMLNLALQSSRRLGAIVDTLAIISGMPTSLQPDAQILDCIYKP